MNKVRSTVVALTCLSMVFLGGKVARCDNEALPVLSIALAKTECITGEPVIVSIKLANESAKPIPRVFGDNESFGRSEDFIFVVTAGDGTKVCEVGRQGASTMRVVLGVLEPGEFWECEKMFLPRMNLDERSTFGQRRPSRLLSPGSYKVVAQVLWSIPGKAGTLLTSNNVEIEVKEPRGVDAEAVNLMRSPELGGFFLGVHGGKPKPVADLLSDYPKSTYAEYARVRLMLDYAGGLWNTSRAATTGEEKKKVANFISEGLDYVKENKDMPLSDNIMLYCARMSRIVDQEEKSVRILRQLVKDFPQSDAAEAAERHLGSWAAPLKPGEKGPGVGKPRQKTALPRAAYVAAAVVVGVAILFGVMLLLKKKVIRGSE